MAVPDEVILTIQEPDADRSYEIRATLVSWTVGGEARLSFLTKDYLTFQPNTLIEVSGYVYKNPQPIGEN